MRQVAEKLRSFFFLGAILSCAGCLGGSSGSDSSTSNTSIAVSSVSPIGVAASTGGTLAIHGQNFVPGAVVGIGTNACTSVSFVSPTLINCNAPPGTVGSVAIMVTNPSGASSTLQNALTYYSNLSISPGTKTTVSGHSFAFLASGGMSPYAYSCLHCSINNSGSYTATLSSGSDTVTLHDSLGNTTTAAVTVNPVLTLSLSGTSTNPNCAVAGTAAGGSGTYTYSVQSGVGAINSSTGIYAAPNGTGSATIAVSDLAGDTATASLSVITNSSGSMDCSFGNAGVFTHYVENSVADEIPYSILVKASDTLSLGGYWTGGGDYLQANLLTNGQLDTSFNSTGLTYLGSHGGTAAAIDASENTYTVDTPFSNFTVRKISPTGSASALATASVSVSISSSSVSSVKVATDGSVLVLLDAIVGGNHHDLVLYKFSSAGASLGTLQLHSGSFSYIGADMVIQADGKVVIVGSTNNGGNTPINRLTVWRVQADLSALDSTFGTSGLTAVVMQTVNDNDVGQKVFLDSTGKILAVGMSNSNICMVRLNTDGSLDNNYGTSAGVITNLTATNISPTSSLPPANFAAALVSGDTLYIAGKLSSAVKVARYTSSGTLDTTFGTSGLSTAFLNFSDVYALGVQSNSKIVVVGPSNTSPKQFLAYRVWN